MDSMNTQWAKVVSQLEDQIRWNHRNGYDLLAEALNEALEYAQEMELATK